MTARLNGDDLMFAKVRAKYLEPPDRVAASLIDAAGHPELLDGVTSADVLMRAADVLDRAGEHRSAASMLRRLLDDSGPDEHQVASNLLAKALIGAGEADEAEALIRAVSAAGRPSWHPCRF